MQFKPKLLLIAAGIVLIAFASGYYAPQFMQSKNLTRKPSNSDTATNLNFDFPHLNPLTECMRNKGMRMDELKSFKRKIEDYIYLVFKENPGLKISYYFRDLNNGMWLGFGEKEVYSPASLMKVPCLIAILKEAQKHPELLSSRIKFDQKKFIYYNEEAGIKKVDGQSYTIDELLAQSIGYSDNAATSMLLDFIGPKKITIVEDDLNLHIEDYFTPFTDFVSVKNYAGIFRILYNASYLNEAMSQRALEILMTSRFESGILAAIPKDIKLAHKYGDRDIEDGTGKRKTIQLHEFGIVYYPGKPYLLGIMIKGDNSKEAKEKILQKLSGITFEEVKHQMESNEPKKNNSLLKEL